jgi:hypothetical protein
MSLLFKPYWYFTMNTQADGRDAVGTEQRQPEADNTGG